MANKNPKNQFTKGNKAAEKWNETTVQETLLKMWATLTQGHEDANGNFVRANDIKTLAEVCLMHDVGKQRWSEWKEKFKESESVTELIKKIEWVIETRLVYSGQTMDIFVLKNHYDYKDRHETDVTTKGKAIEQPTPIAFISVDKLTDEQLEKYIQANAGGNNESI